MRRQKLDASGRSEKRNRSEQLLCQVLSSEQRKERWKAEELLDDLGDLENIAPKVNLLVNAHNLRMVKDGRSASK